MSVWTAVISDFQGPKLQFLFETKVSYAQPQQSLFYLLFILSCVFLFYFYFCFVLSIPLSNENFGVFCLNAKIDASEWENLDGSLAK